MAGRGQADPDRGLPRLGLPGFERALRKHGLLDDDDWLAEALFGRIEYVAVDGAAEPVPHSFKKIRFQRTRGLAACSYSARRLYFGMPAAITIGLEGILGFDSPGETLIVAYISGKQVRTIRWRCLEPGARHDTVAALAARLTARRHSRITELPAETREAVTRWSGYWQGRGAIQAALAAPVPRPCTSIGAWFRALLLMDEARGQLENALGTHPTEDEAAVIWAAYASLVHRYFTQDTPDDPVAAFMTDFGQLLAEHSRTGRAQTEALIRHTLNGSVTAASGSALVQRHLTATGLVALVISRKLDLVPGAIDLIITQSEQSAFDRGFKPSLTAGQD